MITSVLSRRVLRRSARVVVAGAAMLAAVHGASASDDAGLHQFFSAIFGGGADQQAPVVPSVPADRSLPHQAVRTRPLTVRLHSVKPHIVAQVPVKPGKVSIFEDHTLRRGDAVMTARGIRIFAGSANWPYRADDFVALDEAGHLSRDTTKLLAQLDRLPRG